MFWQIALAGLALGASSAAYAPEGAKKVLAAQEKSPTAAAAGPTPAPGIPSEPEQLKGILGKWKWDGGAPATPLGPERKYKASATVTASLDQHWYEIRYDQAKGPHNPMPQKMVMMWGYDAAAKTFLRTAQSNV